MSWIVVGEDKGRVKLISSKESDGMLPKGSYLTVEHGEKKFVLRVDDSRQAEPFEPSPLIVDMDLTPLKQDQECRNIIMAGRVYDTFNRTDGLVDFIPPQVKARRSNQDEINLAIGSSQDGPRVFIATVQGGRNEVLRDESGRPISARLPKDVFFHQIMICGSTGSGKTVAAKYLAQYFVEVLGGAVLAVNAKDTDLLEMNKPSIAKNLDSVKEWQYLNEEPRGVDNYVVYYPSTIRIEEMPRVDKHVLKRVTLDVKIIEPEALTGLLRGISDVAVQNLPNIFRYWQEHMKSKGKADDFTLSGFSRHLARMQMLGDGIPTLNSRGEQSVVPLHTSTFNNIMRNLDSAVEFFDNEDAMTLNEKDILVRGKMSVINVYGNKGEEFGAVLLRDLLRRIVQAKSRMESKVPILIFIDEVKKFYDMDSTEEALKDLDTICRTGRSREIGVIFASQNPSDIPRGLSSVINTKLFFKSDAGASRSSGIMVTDEEMASLKKGFAAASIHELSTLRIVKFPMSLCGVFEGGR
jgi:hypothetical protein